MKCFAAVVTQPKTLGGVQLQTGDILAVWKDEGHVRVQRGRLTFRTSPEKARSCMRVLLEDGQRHTFQSALEAISYHMIMDHGQDPKQHVSCPRCDGTGIWRDRKTGKSGGCFLCERTGRATRLQERMHYIGGLWRHLDHKARQRR